MARFKEEGLPFLLWVLGAFSIIGVIAALGLYIANQIQNNKKPQHTPPTQPTPAPPRILFTPKQGEIAVLPTGSETFSQVLESGKRWRLTFSGTYSFYDLHQRWTTADALYRQSDYGHFRESDNNLYIDGVALGKSKAKLICPNRHEHAYVFEIDGNDAPLAFSLNGGDRCSGGGGLSIKVEELIDVPTLQAELLAQKQAADFERKARELVKSTAVLANYANPQFCKQAAAK